MNADDSSPVPLPLPSYWPIVLALGILLIAIGIIASLIISGVGAVVLLAAIVGWTQENRVPVPGEAEHD